jgi:hypothetical protein
MERKVRFLSCQKRTNNVSIYLFIAVRNSPHVVGSLPLKLMLSPIPGSYSSAVERLMPSPLEPPMA